MWVALSPLAGRDVWEAMCVAYAYQLQQAGDVHKAVRANISTALAALSTPLITRSGSFNFIIVRQVLFFLTCHRVADAVKVYTEAEMFREAILLAKTRLEANVRRRILVESFSLLLILLTVLPQDPLIRELYLEWAEWCERRAMYEQVAKW